jgi:hypothetical protein
MGVVTPRGNVEHAGKSRFLPFPLVRVGMTKQKTRTSGPIFSAALDSPFGLAGQAWAAVPKWVLLALEALLVHRSC